MDAISPAASADKRPPVRAMWLFMILGWIALATLVLYTSLAGGLAGGKADVVDCVFTADKDIRPCLFGNDLYVLLANPLVLC